MTESVSPPTDAEMVCERCPIRSMALFKQVPKEKLEWTQDYRKGQSTVNARDHLYLEGVAHDYVYTLYDGLIKLYKTVNSGKMQAMRIASPGDFLGFQSDPSAPMHHGAQAMTDCVVCAFPREQVGRMLCSYPEIAMELITKNARVMTFCQEHLLSTGAHSARESIAFTLAELNHRLKLLRQFRSDRTVLGGKEIPITQEDLADAVGITPIHANRTLKQLREEGLIFCTKGKIEVLDEQALAQIGNFHPDLYKDADMF